MGLLPERIYIAVEANEYEELIANRTRMEILRDYVESEIYMDKNTIKWIIGTNRKEKDNG
jgi:hypothetical protein